MTVAISVSCLHVGYVFYVVFLFFLPVAITPPLTGRDHHKGVDLSCDKTFSCGGRRKDPVHISENHSLLLCTLMTLEC